jgi:hypothetical protein
VTGTPHANDYDGRRFYCGPRRAVNEPVDRRAGCSAIRTRSSLNYVPPDPCRVRACQGPWDPRQAYLSALHEWQTAFATVGQPSHGKTSSFWRLLTCRTKKARSGNLLDQARSLAGTAERPAAPRRSGAGPRLREFGPGLLSFASAIVPCPEPRGNCARTGPATAAPGCQPRRTPLAIGFHLPGAYRGAGRAAATLVGPAPDGTHFAPALRTDRTGRRYHVSRVARIRTSFIIRPACPGDQASLPCLVSRPATAGQDGEPYYREDPTPRPDSSAPPPSNRI